MQPVIVHLAKIVLMPDSKSRELYMNDVMNWLVQMQSHNRRVTTKRGIPTHTLVSLWEVLVDSIHNQATLLRTSGFKGVKIDQNRLVMVPGLHALKDEFVAFMNTKEVLRLTDEPVKKFRTQILDLL